MISGLHWRVGLLFGAIAWAWLAGCGPKPIDRRVETPQPVIPIRSLESDDAKKPMDTRGEDASADANVADPSNTDAAEEPHFIHKIRWGHETLYSISRWYTGKGHYWRRLAAANPKIKPRRMRIGDTIRIPAALLIRRRPMPETYFNPAATRKPKTPSDPIQTFPSQEPEVQAPPLYGPVGDDAPAPAENHIEWPVPLETLDE